MSDVKWTALGHPGRSLSELWNRRLLQVGGQHLVEDELGHRLDGLVVKTLHGLETEFEPFLDAALQFGYEQRIQSDLQEGRRRRQFLDIQAVGCLSHGVLDLG